MTWRIPPALDDALGFNLYRVALLFRRELMRALAEYDLTPEQWQVLAALWHEDRPLSQTELTHLTLKDKPTLSRMLKRMERDGWLVCERLASDRRTLSVSLSARARAEREHIPRRLYAHFEPLLSALGGAEHVQLLALLKRLRGRMDEPDRAETPCQG